MTLHVAVPERPFSYTSDAFGTQGVHGMLDTYAGRLRAVGLTPIVIPVADIEILTRVDALLLPGGPDIDPALYGGDRNDPHLDVINSEADKAELEAIRRAAQHRIPTLAICRGLQATNIAFGGTLIEHLASHPIDTSTEARIGAHTVHLVAGTQIATLFDSTTLLANTLHHQGIAKVAGALTAVGWTEDGLIEALEPVDREWPMLAVQWHPEYQQSPSHARLFDWLAEQASVYAHRRRR